jgi:hypothetical protein
MTKEVIHKNKVTIDSMKKDVLLELRGRLCYFDRIRPKNLN